MSLAQGFDALVTKDANLQYEQNLVDLPIAVVIMRRRTTLMTFDRCCQLYSRH
jgi:hypothetical protein